MRIWGYLAVVWAAVAVAACRPDFDFSNAGPVDFDRDTVSFDTLFRNRLSPSERLTLRNNTGENLLIDEVFIAGGAQSPFRLTLNGVTAQRHTNLEVLEGDSLKSFTSLQVDVTGGHRIVQDELVVRVGDSEQRIPLIAYVLNAILYQDTVFSGGSFTLPSDTLIVVDGVLLVDENTTVNIDPGTELFFTYRTNAQFTRNSGVQVNGTLNVRGTQANPVRFTNVRLDNDWDITPGQWFGIIYGQTSSGSHLDWAIVENGTIGVLVDSLANNGVTKLEVTNTVVRNQSNYGILTLGQTPTLNDPYMVDAANVLVYNTGGPSVACLQGGKSRFTHCTFAEFGWDFSRDFPTVVFTNTAYEGNTLIATYPGWLEVYNSILWGTLADEFGNDLQGSDPLTLGLLRNSIKVTENELLLDAATGYPDSNFYNADPGFAGPTPGTLPLPEGFFLTAESAVQDLANPLLGLPTGTDLAGTLLLPGEARDLGAYEFVPE